VASSSTHGSLAFRGVIDIAITCAFSHQGCRACNDKLALQIFKFTMCQSPFRLDKLTATAFIAVIYLGTACVVRARCFASHTITELTLSSGFSLLKFSVPIICAASLRPACHFRKVIGRQNSIHRYLDRVKGQRIFNFSASVIGILPSYRVKVFLLGTSEGEEEGDKEAEKEAHDSDLL
jgi:hypothetical protein